MLKLDWEKEVKDSKARIEAEKAEQLEIKKARLAEVDLRVSQNVEELMKIDDKIRELKTLRLENLAKTNDLMDEWGELMKAVHGDI